MGNDTSGLREYAARYVELARSDRQCEKRRLWRDHNSLRFSRPLIYMRAVPYHEFFDMSRIKSTDPMLRQLEFSMASVVDYHSRLDDDSVYEPWLTIPAAAESAEMRWGVPCALGEKTVSGGAAAYQPVIRDEADLEKIITRPHAIDEAETARRRERVLDAVGDIIDVHVDRRGALSKMWNMDISTDLAKLRGLEQIMYDIYDEPEFLHRLMARMRDAVLENIDQTEAAGDFSLADHQNQAMPYAHELRDPSCHETGVKTREMWGFLASQETTTFGPDAFDAFMLEYQLPILHRFGLTAYGCCEDLTRKIPLLRKIKNLRRVAVSPFADLEKCAEQIGGDYVFSYRPNPSSMIATGLNEDFVRATMRKDFAVMMRHGCKFDITLKDVETISAQPQNMIRWVQIVREEIGRAFDG